MTETNKMLEECANYLLNHCFVLGGVEDQRAKYLYALLSGGFITAA